MSTEHRARKPNNTCRGILSGWKCGKAFAVAALFAAATPVVFAQGVATGVRGQAPMSPWSLGEAFGFLFLTLGPFNVIGPFAAMTQGRDTAFKRRLALRAFIVATIALFVAATLGAKTLEKWGISVGALLLTAGVILFRVTLQPGLAGSTQRVRRAESTAAATVPARSVSQLAFSPLAFPTIVAPYGMAVFILLVTLYPFSAGGLRFWLWLPSCSCWIC